jgi:peptidyl-prolyl cis-trans isomerase SurA
MPGLLFRVAAARWLILPLACMALALPAQAQTASKQTQPATKRVRPAAKKPPAKAPARKPAPEAAPAAAPAAAASAAAPAPAPAPKPVSSAPREADFIVAVVNTEPLTNHEVRARMARAQRQMAERSMSAPPSDQLRKEMLERLIAERAQLQYAREIGLKVDEAALAQAELAIARQNQLDSIEELHRRVQQDGLTVAEFRADVRNQVLLARLREREIEPKLKVTDAEVEAYIREQTGARTGTVDLNLAMILVAVPEDSSAADTARLQARAAEVVRRARAGEDFAQLALEFSDANNRGRDGGVLGLRAADRYPELFVQSTERVRVGEIAGPVRSAAGFHVLKVLERKQNKELPEVRIPQTRARHILLRVGPTQGEQVARDRAADFKRRIQAGQASFEELARQYSQDDSAQDGGDLGWANPGQFTPEFERAMNSLDVRQVSDPVVTRFGVHLIRVDDRREQVLTDAEQRLLARNMLRERKAQEAFETWAQEVRGRAYVEYRDPPR